MWASTTDHTACSSKQAWCMFDNQQWSCPVFTLLFDGTLTLSFCPLFCFVLQVHWGLYLVGEAGWAISFSGLRKPSSLTFSHFLCLCFVCVHPSSPNTLLYTHPLTYTTDTSHAMTILLIGLCIYSYFHLINHVFLFHVSSLLLNTVCDCLCYQTFNTGSSQVNNDDVFVPVLSASSLVYTSLTLWCHQTGTTRCGLPLSARERRIGPTATVPHQWGKKDQIFGTLFRICVCLWDLYWTNETYTIRRPEAAWRIHSNKRENVNMASKFHNVLI